MKTITIKGFIYAISAKSWEDGDSNVVEGHRFQWWTFSQMDGYKNVCKKDITFEIPDDFSTVKEEIAGLEKERNELLADTQVKVNRINDSISKLSALTFEEAA